MSIDLFWIEKWMGGSATNFAPFNVERDIFGTYGEAARRADALNAADPYHTYRSAAADRRHDYLDGHCEEGCRCGFGWDPAELTREERATRYIWRSGKFTHSSDCATSLAPAEEPGPCDCDAAGAA